MAGSQQAPLRPAPKTDASKLMHQVHLRLLTGQIARRAFTATIAVAAVYGVALLTGRLTGLFADGFYPWHVALLPLLGLLIGAAIPRRRSLQDAARRIDTYDGTKDLFLTTTMLENCVGDYKPLVTRDAEARAPHIKPAEVVPFVFGQQSLISASILGIVLLASYFVPVLDPFGKVAEAKVVENERKLLENSKKDTELRKAQLAQKDLDDENSEEVDKALEKMKISFSQMKKGERQENNQKLNVHKAEIAKLYQKLAKGELSELMSEKELNQQLGAIGDQETFRKMQRELQQGSSESFDQQLESIKKDLERLTKSEDPVEQAEIKRQIQKQMKELSDFASDKAGAKALHAALERAMDQMQSGENNEALSAQAMEALQESLELAQQEMQSLTQSARDMKSLEEAMQMISMAKQMNAEDQLDGERMGGEMSIEEYEEMYAELMAMGGEGEGDGEGMGGRGIGEGGEAPEDDSVETDFVDEKSKSAIQKGKILLSMKTKGLSDSGDIKDENYKRVVGEIKQSLDNVIEQEQIPPGYIDNIKKYFDTIAAEQPQPQSN